VPTFSNNSNLLQSQPSPALIIHRAKLRQFRS
jgi:peptide methionine sulfoxide reductase MsrA